MIDDAIKRKGGLEYGNLYISVTAEHKDLGEKSLGFILSPDKQTKEEFEKKAHLLMFYVRRTLERDGILPKRGVEDVR